MKLLIPIIVTTLALSGCQLTSAQRTQLKAAEADRLIAARVCGVMPPISYDGRLDTPATKEQIRKYNAARKAFCEVRSTNKGD